MHTSDITPKALVTLCAVLLAGCASSAPPLPTANNQSVDASAYAELSCSELGTAYEANKNELAQLRLKNKRQQKENRVVGYFFMPALLATDDTDVVSAQIAELTAKNDSLLQQYQTRQCK